MLYEVITNNVKTHRKRLEQIFSDNFVFSLSNLVDFSCRKIDLIRAHFSLIWRLSLQFAFFACSFHWQFDMQNQKITDFHQWMIFCIILINSRLKSSVSIIRWRFWILLAWFYFRLLSENWRKFKKIEKCALIKSIRITSYNVCYTKLLRIRPFAGSRSTTRMRMTAILTSSCLPARSANFVTRKPMVVYAIWEELLGKASDASNAEASSSSSRNNFV